MPQRIHVRRGAALAMIAAGAALAQAGSAHAAVTAEATASAATLRGSDDGEVVVVTATGGFLSHNLATDPGFTSALDWDSTAPGDQSLLADNSVTIVVHALGGADTVDFRAGLGVNQAVVDAGAGDDVVFGSSVGDTIAGGDGDDLVVPGPGNDVAGGGDGSDTLVWNNGDGTDTLDGGGGADAVQVNGSPAAADSFVISASGERVRLDRLSPGPFSLDIGSAERLEVDALGGDDLVAAGGGLASLILLILTGGAGADRIDGGDGPDLIQGGDGADVLNGGVGDDRLVGNRGNDAMVGGDGDDTLVWNNGDGTDTANGDAGQDTTEVNGAPGAGDAFTVAPDGQRVRFERTNLGPFSIDMLTESLDLNALGGDDTLSVANGAAVHVDADGGSGADALTGSDGDETLRGGSGNDTLKGGTGSDTLDGGDGDDAIDARDAAGDLVRCGTGTDRATLDAASVDPQTGCETVDRSPEGAVAPRFGAVLVRATRVPARGRRVRIPLRCPANPAGGCRGELILQTAKPVRAGGPRAIVRLGSARFTLPAGRAGAATIRLPAGFALLAPAGAKTLAARIRLYNRGGVFQSRRLAITLPKGAR